MDNNIIEFLKESNNIEDVWDDTSLAQAIYAWNYIIKEDELTPGVILKTHKILSLRSRLLPDEKGYFRKQPVWIGDREGKPWYALPELIENWCKDVMTSVKVPGDNGKHIKIDHIRYEEIHPFIDFNGRTGRIFLNWARVKAGLQVLVIKEEEKHKYYSWFN